MRSDRTVARGSALGMSLLEVVIALGVLAVTLAGLAPLLVRSIAMLAEARDESRAVALAGSRLEQLLALPHEQDATTLALVTDDTTNLADPQLGPGGPGLTPGRADAAWRDTPAQVDWATADGQPLPMERASAASVVRRWAVVSLRPPAGASRLLLVVFARAQGRERREAERTTPRQRPGDVWLFTVRSRTLR